MKDYNEPHYTVEIVAGNKNFTFNTTNGSKLHMGPEVSFMFSYNDNSRTAVLYKHGRPEDVEKHWRKLKEGLRTNGNDTLAENIRMMTVTLDFPLEEMNRFLSIAGYIGIFVRNSGVLGGKEGKNFAMSNRDKRESETV